MISDKGGDYIINCLILAGYDAYYVGGCVRDDLLGRPISDYDITTSAPPEVTKKVFSSCRIIDIGIEYGTVSVIINDKAYEITTFRKDYDYADGRRPDRVDFCYDIHFDLSRRDFSVNSMAFNKKSGLIDDFNGFYDLQNRVIRAVGNPNKRFSEDGLRILRGLRFASTLDFFIESDTQKAMEECRNCLKHIAAERVYSELKGILNGASASRVIGDNKLILSAVFSDLSSLDNNRYVVMANSLKFAENNVLLRLALFFSCFGLNNAKEAVLALKCDKKTLNTICALISAKPPKSERDSDIKRFMNITKDNSLLSIAYFKAIDTAEGGANIFFYDECERVCKRIIKSDDCYTVAQLKINGDDLILRDVKGSKIKDYMQDILDNVIDEKLKNDKTDLLNYIDKKITEEGL